MVLNDSTFHAQPQMTKAPMAATPRPAMVEAWTVARLWSARMVMADGWGTGVLTPVGRSWEREVCDASWPERLS